MYRALGMQRGMQRAFHAAASTPAKFHVCRSLVVSAVETTCLQQKGGGLPRLFTRRFARKAQEPGSRYATKKTTQTKVRDREQEQWAKPPAQQWAQPPAQEEEEERGRQMDSLDDNGVRTHLAKVYGTLGATIGVSAVGSVASITTGMMVSPLIPGLASLVPLFWLYSTTPADSEMKRGLLLGSFALLSGMSTAPLVAMASSMNPMLVPMALGATTGMFGLMTAAAMVAPKGAMLRLGAPLFGGVVCLMGVGVAGFMVDPSSPWYPVLHSVSLYGGLGIFSLYVAYDTQQIIQDYEEGNRDVVHGAVNLFINFKAMFTRFLLIFMGNND